MPAASMAVTLNPATFAGAATWVFNTGTMAATLNSDIFIGIGSISFVVYFDPTQFVVLKFPVNT